MTISEDTLSAEQKAEVLRCAESFSYFCENYLTFHNPTKGRVKAHLHDFQKRYADALQTERLLLVPKFRQGGFTSVTAYQKLWKAIFKFDQTILWINKTASESVSMCSMIKSQVDQLPEWLVGKLVRSNYHQLRFETGSQMLFYNAEAGKGRGVDDLIIDEAAYIDNMKDYWPCVVPMLATGGNAVIISTPKKLKKGEYNWFKDMIWNTETNGFRVFQSKWHEHPDFNNEEWADGVRASLGDLHWRVEVEAEWVEEEDEPKHKPNVNVCPVELKIIHREITQPKLVEPKPDLTFCKRITGPEYEPLDLKIEAETIDLNKTQVDPETRSAIIESFKKAPTEVEHPTFFDDEAVLNNIDAVWEDICEVMPEAKEPPKPPVKDIDYSFDGSVSVDLLKMAGVITESGTLPLDIDFKADVLKKIKRGLPAQLDLDLDGPAVKVNGIPTKINAKAVEMAVLGLSELCSTERAVETVSRLVRRKLQRLF